jgi:hypothetical protein
MIARRWLHGPEVIGLVAALVLAGCCRDTTGTYGVLEQRRSAVARPGPSPGDPLLGDRQESIRFVQSSADGSRFLVGVRTASSRHRIWVVGPSGAIQDSVDGRLQLGDLTTRYPTFSPADPSKILLSGSAPPDSTTFTTDLYVYDLSTQGLRRVTDVPENGRAHFGTFLPDGRHIVYLFRPYGEPAQVRLIDTTGTEDPTILASLPPRQWSEPPYAVFPDGHRLVYADGGRLVLVDLTTGTSTPLTADSSATVRSPRVSPGGSHVLFRVRTPGRGESLRRLEVPTGTQDVIDRTGTGTVDLRSDRRFFSARFAGSARRVVYGIFTDTTDARTGARSPSRLFVRDLRRSRGRVELGTGLARNDLDVTAPFTGQQIALFSDGNRVLFVGRRTYSFCAPTTF